MYSGCGRKERGYTLLPKRFLNGTIAQLVERVVEAREVGGSNPSRPTIKIKQKEVIVC